MAKQDGANGIDFDIDKEGEGAGDPSEKARLWQDEYDTDLAPYGMGFDDEVMMIKDDEPKEEVKEEDAKAVEQLKSEEKKNALEKYRGAGDRTLTVLVEDIDWGNRGHG